MADQHTKNGLAIALAMLATQLNESHDGTHMTAMVALAIEEQETAETMTELCEHFHAIDDKLKAAAIRLAGGEHELMALIGDKTLQQAKNDYLASKPSPTDLGSGMFSADDFFRATGEGN